VEFSEHMKRKWKYVTENDEKAYNDLLKDLLNRFSRNLRSGFITTRPGKS